MQVDFTYTTTNAPLNSLRDTNIVLLSSGFQIGLTKEASTGFYNGTNTVTLGGPGDTWSWNLSPAMVNAFDFGFNFKLISNDAGSHLEFVNGASITIYYLMPNGIKESQSSSSNSNLRIDQKQIIITSTYSDVSEVTIYSILGSKLMMVQLEANSKKEIDFSDFKNGIYVYTIRQGAKLNSGKFILN